MVKIGSKMLTGFVEKWLVPAGALLIGLELIDRSHHF